MSEETHTIKQAFLMFGDALRLMDSTQKRTNTLLESVVKELQSLHRGHEQIVTRMDAAAERSRDMERRFTESERKSDGKIKLLERRLDNHDEQLATLRKGAL